MKALIGTIAMVALAAGAQSPRDYRYSMPIAPSGSEGLQRIELPISVYRGAARADLGDLRIFNGRGELLPFAFAGEPEVSQPAPKSAALPLFPVRGDRPGASGGIDLRLKQRPDGTLVELRTVPPGRATPAAPVVTWIADATGLRDPVRSLRFSWSPPAQGVLTRMHVEASDDLATWRTVVADGPIADLAREGARVRLDAIELPAVRAKYLRFSWHGPSLALESCEAETFAGEAQRSLRELSVAGARGERPGEIVFSTEARVPVERLRVLLPEANSVVPVRIDSRDDPKADWRPAGRGTVYRLVRGGTEVVSPPIAIAPRSDRFWRVTADERAGGFGTGTVSLVVEWIPRQIVFAVRGEGPFELAFGNSRQQPAAYPVTTLIPGYRRHDEFALPVASLGAVVEGRGERAAGLSEWLGSADGKRLTLWGLLLAGVALLAAMAWGLARQVRDPARKEDPPPGGT